MNQWPVENLWYICSKISQVLNLLPITILFLHSTSWSCALLVIDTIYRVDLCSHFYCFDVICFRHKQCSDDRANETDFLQFISCIRPKWIIIIDIQWSLWLHLIKLWIMKARNGERMQYMHQEPYETLYSFYPTAISHFICCALISIRNSEAANAP